MGATGDTDAAVLVRLGEPLHVMRLSIPAAAPGQVVVDIAYSGVCHTQLHEVRGRRGEDRFLPHTLGHEGAGTVLAVGDEVTKVKPGDPVVLTWIRGRGREVGSTVYRSGDTPVNSGAISTFMRRCVTCENRVVPIPKGMPLREAALLGCAIPTGAGSVLNAAAVRPGDSVAVFGAGGIGLSAVAAANLVHAQPIIAVDVLDGKLDLAREAGATHVINARQRDPLAAIQDLTGGRGVDYAIEAAGRRETMELAFRSVRENGGMCVLAGNLPKGERISLDPFDLIKGRRIIGTWGGGTVPDRDIPMYARLHLSGRLNLSQFITHTYRLEEVNQALDDLEAGKVGRALLDMSVENMGALR